MEKNTTRLQQLHQQLMRKKHLKDRMDQLCEQQTDLIGKVEIMKEALWAEQDDVASLEGRSLARYFYLVVGKLDGKRQEARSGSGGKIPKVDQCRGTNSDDGEKDADQ